MSFDRLAPHYRWLEWILAGPKLQRCRTAFLDDLPNAGRALLLGEGNGRFLVELSRSRPQMSVTCVDASAGMLERARRRWRASAPGGSHVEFVQADILEWPGSDHSFEVIATHFFLDCFRADQLGSVVSRVAWAASPDATWVLSDFQEPSRGWPRWRARLILRAMYLFFQWATRLPAKVLTPPDSFLHTAGFVLCERRVSEWGLLRSDRWCRGETS